MSGMEIRPVRPDEEAALGRLVLAAYAGLPGYVSEPDYELELLDVAARAAVADVLVAVDHDGRLLGGLTFVPDDTNPLAEHGVPGAASIRMLGVAPEAEGRGVGTALVTESLWRARASGARELVLHSTDWMHGAHRLYLRLGFRRDPELDWTPAESDVVLLGFRHPLTDLP